MVGACLLTLAGSDKDHEGREDSFVYFGVTGSGEEL